MKIKKHCSYLAIIALYIISAATQCSMDPSSTDFIGTNFSQKNLSYEAAFQNYINDHTKKLYCDTYKMQILAGINSTKFEQEPNNDLVNLGFEAYVNIATNTNLGPELYKKMWKEILVPIRLKEQQDAAYNVYDEKTQKFILTTTKTPETDRYNSLKNLVDRKITGYNESEKENCKYYTAHTAKQKEINSSLKSHYYIDSLSLLATTPIKKSFIIIGTRQIGQLIGHSIISALNSDSQQNSIQKLIYDTEEQKESIKIINERCIKLLETNQKLLNKAIPKSKEAIKTELMINLQGYKND